MDWLQRESYASVQMIQTRVAQEILVFENASPENGWTVYLTVKQLCVITVKYQATGIWWITFNSVHLVKKYPVIT